MGSVSLVVFSSCKKYARERVLPLGIEAGPLERRVAPIVLNAAITTISAYKEHPDVLYASEVCAGEDDSGERKTSPRNLKKGNRIELTLLKNKGEEGDHYELLYGREVLKEHRGVLFASDEYIERVFSVMEQRDKPKRTTELHSDASMVEHQTEATHPFEEVKTPEKCVRGAEIFSS